MFVQWQGKGYEGCVQLSNGNFGQRSRQDETIIELLSRLCQQFGAEADPHLQPIGAELVGYHDPG